MVNPYASPAPLTSDEAAKPHRGVLEIRWTNPTGVTFASFAMLWSLCTGVVAGLATFLSSLFGVECRVHLLVWSLEGIWAGLVSILLAPVLFIFLGALVAIWSPAFRLLARCTGGLRLRFHARHDDELHFSRLGFRSFIMLASLCGLFWGLFAALLVAVVLLCGTDPDNLSVAGVPKVLDGLPGALGMMLATPLAFAVYAAVSAVPAFPVFRSLVRGINWAVLPRKEITPGRPGHDGDES